MMQEPTEKRLFFPPSGQRPCLRYHFPLSIPLLLLVRDLGICSFLVSVALGIFFLIRYFLYGISVEGWTS